MSEAAYVFPHLDDSAFVLNEKLEKLERVSKKTKCSISNTLCRGSRLLIFNCQGRRQRRLTANANLTSWLSRPPFPRNASNHIEQSWHPKVRRFLTPSLNYGSEVTNFPGNFYKQLSHSSVVSITCSGVSVQLRGCMLQCETQFVRWTHVSQGAGQVYHGRVNLSLPFTHVAHWLETNSELRIKS